METCTAGIPYRIQFNRMSSECQVTEELVMQVAGQDEASPIIAAFYIHQQELDKKNDKYERLVKLGRDVTIESKRTIFLLQRITGKENKNKLLQEAKKKLLHIQKTYFMKIALELEGQDPYQFIRAYSPGVQEYIEAVTFLQYLTDGSLLDQKNVQESLIFRVEDRTVQVLVTPQDYILGVADLTGEVMRLAISQATKGQLEVTHELCLFLQTIHDCFVSLGNITREIPRKLQTMKQSLYKVEKACYTVKVRGSEMPQHLLMDKITFEPEYHIQDFDHE